MFCEKPDSILIDETSIDLLPCKVVNDNLERHTRVVPLKTYRFLNSKRGLGCKYNQLQLTERFATYILTLTNQILEWPQSYRYIGAVEANVEDAGGFHVVDLNVRITGSCCLPLLRTHFTT